MKLPFYLDTIGTFLTAAVFGPFYGAVVGGLTNIISALILGPKDIPFALVSIAIGLIVGFVVKGRKNYDLKTAIICGLVCGVVAPLIGTPIGIAVYGGLTGTVGDVPLPQTERNQHLCRFLHSKADQQPDGQDTGISAGIPGHQKTATAV